MSLAGQLEVGSLVSACADPLANSSPSPAAESRAPAPLGPAARAIFVATDLAWWTTDEPKAFSREFQVDGVMYQKLTLAYYTWLWSRVRRVIRAYDVGRIDRPAFDGVIDRWSVIYKWAQDFWGTERLDAVVRAYDPWRYHAPRPAWDKDIATIFPDRSVSNSWEVRPA